MTKIEILSLILGVLSRADELNQNQYKGRFGLALAQAIREEIENERSKI